MLKTQQQQLLELFESHGRRLLLGDIMQTTLAAEYRARMTDLRRKGYTIRYTRGETPSQNVYQLWHPGELPI